MRDARTSAETCLYCGYKNFPKNRFCLGCGKRIRTDVGEKVTLDNNPKVLAQARVQNMKVLTGEASGPVDLSCIPSEAIIAGIFALSAAGVWAIAAIIAISFGGLALIIGVWNLIVCAVIVIVALQLLKCNANFRQYAIGLFTANVFLMGFQMVFVAEVEPMVLMLDVLGLGALGIQAGILVKGGRKIQAWHNAKFYTTPNVELCD